MFIKKLIIGLLSFYAYEVNQSSKNFFSRISEGTQIESVLQTRKIREAEKKKTRLYDKRKWKKKKEYRNRTLKITGVHAKDHRYSNQRTLRRMYRGT